MKTLTVKELIAGLKTMNPEALVGVAADSEGNAYSLIANESYIVNKVYLKNELGCQDTYFEEAEMATNSEMVRDAYGNEIKKNKLKEVVILWPTN